MRRTSIRYIEKFALDRDEYSLVADANAQLFDWWRATIVGKSYLREQIRRMMGTLFWVARLIVTYAFYVAYLFV